MEKIHKNLKILHINHNDFDAACCSIVLKSVYKNIKTLYFNFNDIDKFMENLDYSKWDKVFITDISPTNQELAKHKKIVLVDHHESALQLNSPKEMRFVIPGICAAKLCKKFIENMYDIKLDHLKSLVHICNDYDNYFLKNPKSKLMNDLCFFYYRPQKFAEVFKDGRTRFNKEELKWLHERRDLFKSNWNNLEVFDMETIKGCITIQNDFLNEIADKLIKEEDYKIVIVKNPSNSRVSLRHKIEDWDSGTYLKDRGMGGGHKEASGIITKDEDDFKNKIQKIEKYLFDNFKDIRRN